MSDQLKIACSKCGAQLGYSPGQQSLKCDFCGETTQIPKEEDKISAVDECDYIVPLTVDKNSLVNVTQSYMVTGDFTPDDLLDSSVITKQWLHYVPSYIFSGSYEAQWTASFGYDRKEHYTEFVTRTNNGRSYQEPVTRTKTVTDWRPVNGVDSGTFAVQVYAGNKMPANVHHLIEINDLSKKITAFKDQYLVGCDVEPFSIKERSAYLETAEPRVNSIIDSSVKSHGQGDHQRDWHWTATIDKNASTALMPVAHSVFEYAGKEYHVWIDGSDPSRMVGDALPVDEKKKKAAYLGAIPLGVTIVALIVAFNILGWDAIGWLTLLSLLVSIGYGAKRHSDMVNYSKSIRNSLLVQKQASSSNTQVMSDEDKAKLVSSYTKPKLPFFADASRDKIVLPAVSFISALLILIPVFTAPSPGKLSSTEVVATQPESTEQGGSTQAEMSPAALDLYNKASESFEKNNYTEALNLLEQALALAPNHPEISKAIEIVKSKM